MSQDDIRSFRSAALYNAMETFIEAIEQSKTTHPIKVREFNKKQMNILRSFADSSKTTSLADLILP
jgi:16S rRNA U1498 N3-methylase RsmE